MAVGFPAKTTFATGDVLTATNVNDITGTLNLLNPSAKGTIIAASAANTPLAVAVGTDGQVLTADAASSAGVKWASASSGGMTQLGSTTTLSGASTLISGISGSYNKLFIEIIDFYMSANASVLVRFNSDATANAYQQVSDYYSAAVATAQQAPYLDKLTSCYATYGSVLNSDNNNYACLELPNYASSMKKLYVGQSQYLNAGSNNNTDFIRGAWFNSTAISSLLFVASSGTFSGGTVKVWGIK